MNKLDDAFLIYLSHVNKINTSNKLDQHNSKYNTVPCNTIIIINSVSGLVVTNVVKGQVIKQNFHTTSSMAQYDN